MFSLLMFEIALEVYLNKNLQIPRYFMVLLNNGNSAQNFKIVQISIMKKHSLNIADYSENEKPPTLGFEALGIKILTAKV